MSYVAVYLLPCCKRKVSFGRFIPPDDAMKRPEMKCPLCGKRITLHRNMGELIDEHKHNILSTHKYVLPVEENDLLW